MIVIGVSVLIIFIIEFCFQEFDIFCSFGQFIVVLILIFFMLIITSLGQIIEKYLIEVDKLSPFYILMIEGIFGIILSTVAIISTKAPERTAKMKENLSNTEFVFLIIANIIYIILSGGKNIFRLVTIKIFSPMTSTFMDYILNPFYIIYYFSSGNDFLHNGKSNYAYFIINLILSLVITFCGFVYNEFVILFCCGLERNTHDQVTLRSFIETELHKLDNENEEENEEDEREEDVLFKYTKIDLK